MVAEHDDQVVGYMIYELNKNHLDLLNIAVAREWQRRGVGTAMVRKLSLKLNPQRRTHLWTVVRETNLDGQLFLSCRGVQGDGSRSRSV